MSRMPIVVLISGSGSNLQALIDGAATGTLPVVIRAVISNREDAYGLKRAADAGVPTRVVNHRDYDDARAFGRALAEHIDEYAPDLVVLAGFMRILHPDFVTHYEDRLINLHPSLLPKYPGLHTHERVLKHGDAVHGASVHFVTAELDSGPVIIQGRIPVTSTDTPDTLQEKVHAVEHHILPKAVRWFAEKRLTKAHGRVLLDGGVSPEQGLAVAQDTNRTSTPITT